MEETQLLLSGDPSGLLSLLLAAFVAYFLCFRRGDGDDGGDVPWAPGGGVPLLGHALTYKSDPAGFLTRMSLDVGPIFRLNLAGKRMVVVCGKSEQKFLANLPESKLSSRQAVADIGFEQTLGEFNVHRGTDLHKGIIKAITWHHRGSRSGEADFVTSLASRLQRSMSLETRKAGEHDLFKLVRRVVLRSTIDWMVAPAFLEGYPRFLDEFMLFQDELEEVTAKSVVLPKWISLPLMLWPFQRKRLKLQRKIAGRLRQMLANKREGTEEGFWLEQTLKKHGDNMSLVAELIVGLLFAAHKNPSIGAAQSFLFLHEMGTPEDLDLCREEAKRFLQHPGRQTLQLCHRLRRLCLETLRLTAHSIGGIRTAKEDIPIDVIDSNDKHRQHRIAKGSSVGLAHISSSWNPDLWERPRQLDTTSRAEEAYEDEYRFTTFSHGVHKCPGQAIALSIMEIVLATMLEEYAITLPPEIPRLSFERATLAQREGPVMVAIRSKG